MQNIYTDKAAADILTRARSRLLLTEPFFGALAMRLNYIEDPSIPTLNIDGTNMRYNPSFVRQLEPDLVRSGVGHEVLHCILHHCGANSRGAMLNPQKWNAAVDYAVNSILKEAGFRLGEGWYYDSQFAGMSAEHIYSLLPDMPPNATPAFDTHESNAADPSGQKVEEIEWKLATIQAANNAKAQGKLSKGLEQFVDRVKEAQIDWRAELRQFISVIAKGDYAWQRPSKKMQAAGFILPGLYSEEIGTIVIANDESGSVDKAITAAFAAEISAIKEDLRPEKLVLLHFDSDVRKVEEFGPDDPFKMTRFCSGGTDFRPAMQFAEDMNPRPMCMIYLTDLYGPFPKHDPGFPVLWVSVTNLVAPFGTTLKIEV